LFYPLLFQFFGVAISRLVADWRLFFGAKAARCGKVISLVFLSGHGLPTKATPPAKADDR
jgi:hypothetical protein